MQAPARPRGVLRGSNVLRLIPDESVTKLHVGDQSRLTAEQFGRPQRELER